MMTCPACGKQNPADTTTCSCGADLTLLVCLEGQCDAWFNRALAALAEGRPGRAVEWLSACCAARPSDAAAWRALARVWAQIGRWDDARRAVERAAEVDPDAPDLEAIRQAIAEAATPARTQKAAKTQRADRTRAGRKRAKPGGRRKRRKSR